MLEPETYASVGDAYDRLSTLARVLPHADVVRTLDSLGRVLAEDVLPSVNLPPRDVSHMDGYAVNSEDLVLSAESNPARLKLVGEVKLGEDTWTHIARGETIKVPTGGYIPGGSDSVVPVEAVRIERNLVVVPKLYPRGTFVYRKGTDVKKGRRVLAKGHELRPQDVGLLLSLGIPEVKVYRKPRVAIIATGDELAESGEEVKTGKTPNSHGYVFSKFVEMMGGEPLDLGIVKDSARRIARKIERALKEADMVLTIGGTSLGSLDLVRQALGRFVRQSQIIHGIKMDRGRVAGVTVIRGRPIVMLPGPIQGAMSAFVLFVAPMIRALGGHNLTERSPLKAKLSEDWQARQRFAYFTKVMYVKATITGGDIMARPIVGETESMTVLTKANGYVIVPEEKTEIRRGESVDVHVLPGFSYLGDRFLD